MTTFVLQTGFTPIPLLRPRLMAFLRDRLEEELVAARRRVANGTGHERGVTMIGDVLRGLQARRAPSVPVTRMLLLAYAAHPDFDSRWTNFDSVTVTFVDSGGTADERSPSGME